MHAILLGVDGTGDLSDERYARSMRNSFVSYIVRHAPATTKRYMRGPAFDGLDMSMIIGMGFEYVHLHKHVQPDARVLLTGYSRGGAAAIGVAARLARAGTRVDAMVLFDPVNRSVTSETDDVPRNVLNLYQAWRMADTFSRVSFNNCARTWHHPTRCARKFFWATHGGMGGVPWKPGPGQTNTAFVSEGWPEVALMTAEYNLLNIAWKPNPGDTRGQDDFLAQRLSVGNRTRVTYQEDLAGARAVWEWMAPHLRKEGFLGGAH